MESSPDGGTQMNAIYFVDDSDDEVFISKIAFEKHAIDLEIHHFFDLPSYFTFLHSRTVAELDKSMTILDLNLTVDRGTSGVARVRAQPQFSNHIVGICSGSDDPADRQDAIAAGAGFFIAKPLNLQALEAITGVIDELDLVERDGRKHLVRSTAVKVS